MPAIAIVSLQLRSKAVSGLLSSAAVNTLESKAALPCQDLHLNTCTGPVNPAVLKSHRFSVWSSLAVNRY